MFIDKFTRLAPLVAAGALTIAGCGNSSSTARPASTTKPGAVAGGHTGAMHMIDKHGGLATAEDGYRLRLDTTTAKAGRSSTLRFQIQAPDGKPHTAYAIDQTKRLHFYVVRRDLTGYQHLHPTLAPDGTWSVPVTIKQAGPYRVYTDFVAKDTAGAQHPVVLSQNLSVPGPYHATQLPAPTPHVTPDGYTVAMTGALKAGTETPLSFTISRAGKPVTDLQPYLDTFAHMTALKGQTLNYSHLHPLTKATTPGHAGPGLKFAAELPTPGRYRLFLQFKVQGKLHLAAFTVQAR